MDYLCAVKKERKHLKNFLKQRIQRSKYLVLQHIKAVSEYSRGKLLITLKAMELRLKFTTNSISTQQIIKQNTLYRQVLFVHSQAVYILEIMCLAERLRKEVEALQTEIFLLWKLVFLFTHMLQIILLTLIV